MEKEGRGSVVIPLGQIDDAGDRLHAHVRMIQRAAKWLEKKGYHAQGIYFSILCLEEISRCYVMEGCKSDKRGVTKKDLEELGSHKKKIARFVDCTMAALHGDKEPQGRPGSRLPPSEDVGAALARVKEYAIYFDFYGGVANTLEGRLGSGPMKEMARLLKGVAAQGISVMPPYSSAGQVPQKAKATDPKTGIYASLARVVEIARGLDAGDGRGDDVVICRNQLDTALDSLWDYLAVSTRITDELHRSGNEEASAFMAAITFEEGVRYYLLAKCRREGRDVLRRDMGELRTHKKKLSAFLKDVARALGAANMDGKTGTYKILDPCSFVNLNAVKELAVYFVYMGDKEMTLRGIFGCSVKNLAEYVNNSVQGAISWMIMCDGDSSDPYRRHNKNSIHLARYEQFAGWVQDPKNSVTYAGWYVMVGLLKGLNDELRSYNVKQSMIRLEEIRRLGFG